MARRTEGQEGDGDTPKSFYQSSYKEGGGRYHLRSIADIVHINWNAWRIGSWHPDDRLSPVKSHNIEGKRYQENTCSPRAGFQTIAQNKAGNGKNCQYGKRRSYRLLGNNDVITYSLPGIMICI